MYSEEDRRQERFRSIEYQLNRLADLIELLARDRHDTAGHAKRFPERGVSPLDWCDDEICRSTHEAV